MSIVERNDPPAITLKHNKFVLQVRPGFDAEQRKEVAEGWYREQVRFAALPLVAAWEPKLAHLLVAVTRIDLKKKRAN